MQVFSLFYALSHFSWQWLIRVGKVMDPELADSCFLMQQCLVAAMSDLTLDRSD